MMVSKEEGKKVEAGAQAERLNEIEKALLRREIDGWIKTINPAIVAICRAIPRHSLENKDASAVAAAISNSIAWGIVYQGRYDYGDAEISATSIENALSVSAKQSLTARVVAAFLDRVKEIGDIAETAAQGAANG